MRLHRWIIAVALVLAATFGSAPLRADPAFSDPENPLTASTPTATDSKIVLRTTLRVVKLLVPREDPGRFNLRIDGAFHASSVGHAGTTGAVVVQPGIHTVSETAGLATNILGYSASFSGACNAAGSVTVNGGQNKTCYITNRAWKWTTKAPMPTPRLYFGIGVVGTAIYVVGGQGNPQAMTMVDRYIPATDTWTARAPMPTPRLGLGVGVVNGILYATGGQTLNSGSSIFTTTNKVEAYHPGTNSWSTKAPMLGAREGHAVVVLNGILYAIGGQSNGSYSAKTTVQAYNPATNSWSLRSPLPVTRAKLGATVLNGKIYAVGGTDASESNKKTVYEYNAVTDAWTAKPSMLTVRRGVAVGVLNNVLYAIGGNNGGSYFQKAEAYTLASNNWSTIKPMPTIRSFHGIGVVGGRLYAIGGESLTAALTKVESYGPP